MDRPMPRGRLAVGLASLSLLLAAAGWWALSPQWTLAAMQRAALAGDASAIAERVDFPALRASLQRELLEELDQAAARNRGPLAQLGLALARQHVPPLVESAVTPESLELLMASAGALAPGPMLEPLALLAAPDVTVEREGLDSFRVRLADAGPEAPALHFRREGLGWKLDGVTLPAGPLPGTVDPA
jgi:hypothetical protein